MDSELDLRDIEVGLPLVGRRDCRGLGCRRGVDRRRVGPLDAGLVFLRRGGGLLVEEADPLAAVRNLDLVGATAPVSSTCTETWTGPISVTATTPATASAAPNPTNRSSFVAIYV
ncbi:hypothetical protein ACFQL4_06690 [Halosimplex aquaticum]